MSTYDWSLTGEGYDPDSVDFAKLGALWWAELSAPEPSGLDAYPSGYRDLGALSTDGVEEEMNEEMGDVQIWQAGGKFKEWRKTRDFAFGFTMMARTLDTVSTYYGIPTSKFKGFTSDGTAVNDPQSQQIAYFEWVDGGAPDIDERKYSIDVATRGGRGHDRIAIPRGLFTAEGKIKYNRDDTVQLPGKISAKTNEQGFSVRRRSDALVLPVG